MRAPHLCRLPALVLLLASVTADMPAAAHDLDQLPGEVIMVNASSYQLPRRIQGRWLALEGKAGKQRLQRVEAIFWRSGDEVFPYDIHTRPRLPDGTLLFRGLGLTEGPLDAAVLPANVDLQGGKTITISTPRLGRIDLSYPCVGKNQDTGLPECSVRIDVGGQSQRIDGYSFSSVREGSIRVSFAGDLDRDGRFDLGIEYSSLGEGFCGGQVYFLSSLAHPGSLLHSVDGPQTCD